LAKQVGYLAPGILAKLDADPAIRQAVLALIRLRQGGPKEMLHSLVHLSMTGPRPAEFLQE
jgi:hypothetical protein